jgi:hypothetical protein
MIARTTSSRLNVKEIEAEITRIRQEAKRPTAKPG